MPPALHRENVINDGTTTAGSSSGTLANFALALRNKKIDDDIMVATADTLFYPDTVNVWGIMQYFTKKGTDLVACYHPEADEDLADRMLVKVDSELQHATLTVFDADSSSARRQRTDAFASPPGKQNPAGEPEPEPEPEGVMGLCPTMYCFKRETLPRVYEYLLRVILLHTYFPIFHVIMALNYVLI